MANLYNHILTVEDAKRYLRLEPDFTDDDEDIENMIASAFGYLEKATNYIFRPQDKTYYKGYLEHLDVFDWPINTSDYPDGVFPLYYSSFTRFCELDQINLNVGFTSKDSVPYELIDCAKQIIKVFYYEAEKNENTTLLPMSVNQIINSNKRFIAV